MQSALLRVVLLLNKVQLVACQSIHSLDSLLFILK